MEKKVIVMTGSPKPYCETKAQFLETMSEFGYEEGQMSKKDNVVEFLVTNDLNSVTSKMKLAKELGVKIITYAEMLNFHGIIDLE